MALFGLLHRERLDAELVAATRAYAERFDTASERRLTALATARARLVELEGEREAGADAW